MDGSGKLPWGRGLCTTCDQCRATSSLSHPITGWTLTRLTGAGQSSFFSLAATVSHVARERWLEGVLDFTHRIQIPQCTLGFVKRNYCCVIDCIILLVYTMRTSSNLSLQLISFNDSMEEYLYPIWCVDWYQFSKPKSQHCSHWNLEMDIWFHPQFPGHRITYPHRD